MTDQTHEFYADAELTMHGVNYAPGDSIDHTKVDRRRIEAGLVSGKIKRRPISTIAHGQSPEVTTRPEPVTTKRTKSTRKK